MMVDGHKELYMEPCHLILLRVFDLSNRSWLEDILPQNQLANDLDNVKPEPHSIRVGVSTLPYHFVEVFPYRRFEKLSLAQRNNF